MSDLSFDLPDCSPPLPTMVHTARDAYECWLHGCPNNVRHFFLDHDVRHAYERWIAVNVFDAVDLLFCARVSNSLEYNGRWCEIWHPLDEYTFPNTAGEHDSLHLQWTEARRKYLGLLPFVAPIYSRVTV